MAIERSPAGLRDALFDLLDGMRSGSVSPKQAKIECEIAARIIDTGRLELQSIQAARQGLELAAMLAGGGHPQIGPGEYGVEVNDEGD